MTAAADGAKPYYYVPQPSHYPITGAIALLLMGSGAAFWFNGYPAGPWMVAAGFAVLLFMLFGWFGTVIGESEGHLYNKKVDLSFRWQMGESFNMGKVDALTLGVELLNVLDTDPPFVASRPAANGGGGYDATVTNPVGRAIAVSLRSKF